MASQQVRIGHSIKSNIAVGWLGSSIASLIFIEASVFKQEVLELSTDEEYAGFQSELAANPLAGDVIEGTAGCARCAWLRATEANEAAHA